MVLPISKRPACPSLAPTVLPISIPFCSLLGSNLSNSKKAVLAGGQRTPESLCLVFLRLGMTHGMFQVECLPSPRDLPDQTSEAHTPGPSQPPDLIPLPASHPPTLKRHRPYSDVGCYFGAAPASARARSRGGRKEGVGPPGITPTAARSLRSVWLPPPFPLPERGKGWS